MNLTNLEQCVGKSYKYKALCDLLGEESTTGNAKKKQLEEWYRYFEYDKVGAKFYIYKIRSKPLPKQNKYIGNSKYYEYLENIILFTLNKSEDYHIICSVSKALMFTSLVNQNYLVGRSNIKDSSEYLEVDEEYLYMFYNISHNKFRNIFENVLETMRNKALLDFMKCTIVCRKDLNFATNKLDKAVINKDNSFTYEIEHNFEIATDEELKIIKETERDVLDKLNYETMQQCYVSGNWERFKTIVNEILYEKINVEYYYNGYSIILNKKGIQRKVDKMKNGVSKNKANNIALKSIVQSKDKRLTANNDDKLKLADILINNKTNIRLEDAFCIQ